MTINFGICKINILLVTKERYFRREKGHIFKERTIHVLRCSRDQTENENI